MRKPLVLLVLVLALVSCGSHDDTPAFNHAQSSTSSQISQPKVVIFAIDGPRYTEFLGDPSHAWIPHIWNDLRPQGTILTNLRNNGWTTTVPGHTTIVTGTWQYLANDGSERPDKPTIFEYYRRWFSAPASETYVISGKSKLNVCAFGTHPDYGSTYGATASVGHSGDLAVYDELMSVLQSQKPRLVLACFPDVDLMGHSGVWDNYVSAITGADSLAWKTWNYLQSEPYYAGQTYMFIINDHGRHSDDRGGFTNHGDDCLGCSRLIFMALGPDVRVGHTSNGLFTQKDVCRTVGQIFGFPTPYAEGTVIQDVFQFAPTGIKEVEDSISR
jgi:hypothetical protein